jgi:hypothetical protein
MLHPILRFTVPKPAASGPKSGGGSLILRRFQKAHVSGHVLIMSFGPAAHAVQRGEKRPSHLGQRILDSSDLRFDFPSAD